MRGLSYEQLAEVYELRHGIDPPMPWKVIARKFKTTQDALWRAINKLEVKGLNRDANGRKAAGRVTRISDADLRLIDKARKSGFEWSSIAARMGLNESTVLQRWRRWKLSNNPEK